MVNLKERYMDLFLQASVFFFHAPSKATAASSNHAAPVALARAPLVSPAMKLGAGRP